MMMNSFFGPAGRLFDSDAVQLDRNRGIVERQLKQLRTLSLDEVLQVLANVYVLGMSNGVKYERQHFEARCDHVKQHLMESLNDADSVEFMVMDQAICIPLMAANGVEDVYDLDDAPQIEIEKEDLFQIYVNGWTLGSQTFIFQMKKNELAVFDDAWLYRTANKIARQHACALSYDDYREDTVQQTYGEQLLATLNESLSRY
jgi:hypothetical protein